MEYRAFGQTGWKISAIGFGAWGIGGDAWGTTDDKTSLAALHKAIDLGVNFIDTADVYGDGHSEQLIAQVRKTRSEQLIVATKAGRRLNPHTAPGYNRQNLTSFRATQVAARVAFVMAGFGPERVDFAELHDAFTPFELIALEDIGLIPVGKASRATLDGETALDGRLPINPSGGLKARGHPLAATGLAQIVECVWQLLGRAEGRQLEGRTALAHSIGGLATNNWVTVLERL